MVDNDTVVVQQQVSINSSSGGGTTYSRSANPTALRPPRRERENVRLHLVKVEIRKGTVKSD